MTTKPTIDDGGPAFPQRPDTPIMNSAGEVSGWLSHYVGWPDPGMSLRDHFAGEAMAAILSAPDLVPTITNTDIAKIAYKMADAMIAARKEAQQ